MATILVIDDNHLMRQMLNARLSRADFTVIEAEDGESGVKMATEQKPNIILCDLMMPDINGYAVLKRLKANPETAKIPFLIMTAAYTPLTRQEGLLEGADEVIQKPTPFEQLLVTLNGYLEPKA
jgi:CheY-like chemotaxis protein